MNNKDKNMLKAILKIQSSPRMNLLRQLSFSYHSIVAREPRLWYFYQPYILWGKVKRKALNPEEINEGLLLPDTELVIDGFQGSANSFATVAFKYCQTQPVRLMHHCHAPVLIIKAIQQQVPVLLTVRQPIDTVMSLTSRWSYISVNQALKSYIGFYTKLKPYTDQCIISTFQQTTQHLDKIIEVLNDQFNTQFDLVDVGLVNADCRKKVSDSPERAARRKALKEENRQELLTQKNQDLVEKAQHLYQYYEKCAQQNFVTQSKLN
jgi:hypothetical protein